MNEAVLSVVATTLQAALMVPGAWWAMHADRKVQARGNLLCAAGMAIQTIVCVLMHLRVLSVLNAAMTAIFLYFWWNNGGGDGMKKRFKAWTESLRMRTGPQAA